MCTPTNRVLKYIKQNLTELKEAIDKYASIIRSFNTPLSVINVKSRQKIRNCFKNLNNIIKWIGRQKISM